jgi:hypothetical protein
VRPKLLGRVEIRLCFVGLLLGGWRLGHQFTRVAPGHLVRVVIKGDDLGLQNLLGLVLDVNELSVVKGSVGLDLLFKFVRCLVLQQTTFQVLSQVC